MCVCVCVCECVINLFIILYVCVSFYMLVLCFLAVFNKKKFTLFQPSFSQRCPDDPFKKPW